VDRRFGTTWGCRGASTALRLGALALVAATAVLLAPAEASAQFGTDRDYCADSSPYGVAASGPTRTTLTVALGGPGTVSPSMYDTPASCMEPTGACTAGACSYQVQTVCPFHCYSHRHLGPQAWDVRLSPSGSSFLGWSGAECRPVPSAAYGRADCLVLMSQDRAVTAQFGPDPDGAPDPAPALTVNPGPYWAKLSWTPANDAWLRGYEIWLNGKLVTRLPRSQTQYDLSNLLCASNYTLRVIAFDAANEASSGDVAMRTDACSPALRPRPRTVIHVKPRRVTHSRAAFFHFGYAGTIRANRFQCKVDRGRWARCSGLNGKRYRNLPKGRHTFLVRAGNAAGYDRTPATWRWRIS
jgi:Fibronectin type III domain